MMHVIKIQSTEPLKVLTVPDMHFKAKNPKNRVNYLREQLEMLDAIVALVKLNNVDIVVFLGDFYDGDFKGEQSDAINLAILTRLNFLKTLGVRTLTLLGNHEKHKLLRGHCPLFDIMTYDSEKIQMEFNLTKVPIREYTLGLLETTDILEINGQSTFIMHHFSDFDKEYKTPDLGYKTTIGLFHDAILPSQARSFIMNIAESDLGKYSKVVYSDSMFNNLNYAVLGDIHARIGEMTVKTDTGDCLADIPGSVMRTQYGISQSHESLNLPLFTITGDTVVKSHLPLKLWSYSASFKIDISEANKAKRKDISDFNKSIEKITAKRTYLGDLDSFPDSEKRILSEINTYQGYQLKSKESALAFLNNYKNGFN